MLKCTKRVNIKCKNCCKVFSTVTLLEEHNKKGCSEQTKKIFECWTCTKHFTSELGLQRHSYYCDGEIKCQKCQKYFHLNLIWNIILKCVSVFWYVTFAAWGVKQLNCCKNMLQVSIRIKWSMLVRHVGMSFIPNNPSLHMLLQIIKQCFSHHKNQIIFLKRKLINSLYTSKYHVLPTIALK